MRNPKKEAFIFIALVISIILISSLGSAEILMGQTGSVYNVGDTFDIEIKVKSQIDTSNFLTATLVCGQKEIALYRSPLLVKKGEDKRVKIETQLGKFLVTGNEGLCYIKAQYEADEATSQKFEITKHIEVFLDLETSVLNPGDFLRITGRASKSNGALLNGFVEVSLPEIEFSFSGQVIEGSFAPNFTIPSNSRAGNYKIFARVYESDSTGEILNEGENQASLRINQVLKKLDIAVTADSIVPETEFSFTIVALDQANDPYNIETAISIFYPNEEVFEKYLVQAGETITIPIEPHFTPGPWTIEAKAGEFYRVKTFHVEEYKHLSFGLDNSTIFIKNTGNVPYSGPVEISIGGVNEIKELSDLQIE